MAAPTPPVVPLPALRSDPTTFKDRAEANIVFFEPLVEYMAEVCGFTDEKAAEALAAALVGDLPNISGKDGQVLYVTGGGLGFKLVQTGVHDDTTNALMPVGAFGLGQKGSTTTVTLNGTTRTGFYNYGATDPDRPPAITTGGSFIAVRYATNWISQIIFAPNANLTYYRYTTDNGATWSAWTRIMLGTDIATVGQAQGGGNNETLMTPLRTKQAIDANNTVKARLNFNGTGTISIIKSSGIDSIVDLGTGNYRVNLSITMPDTDYIVMVTSGSFDGTNVGRQALLKTNQSTGPINKTTTSFEILTGVTSNGALADHANINLIVVD